MRSWQSREVHPRAGPCEPGAELPPHPADHAETEPRHADARPPGSGTSRLPPRTQPLGEWQHAVVGGERHHQRAAGARLEEVEQARRAPRRGARSASCGLVAPRPVEVARRCRRGERDRRAGPAPGRARGPPPRRAARAKSRVASSRNGVRKSCSPKRSRVGLAERMRAAARVARRLALEVVGRPRLRAARVLPALRHRSEEAVLGGSLPLNASTHAGQRLEVVAAGGEARRRAVAVPVGAVGT